jgi:hypothetical protein
MRRLIALSVAIGAGALLAVAAFLTPASEGLGTHEQLNMPACGWITIMDLPCPTCGMTTAFAHAADGNLVASFLSQPMGFVLAIATAMALIVSTYVAMTGAGIGIWLRRLWGPWTGWLIAGAVLLSWGFKVVSYRGWM